MEEPILQFFSWTHLPPRLQQISMPFGQLVCTGKLNSALVEFADGFKVVTSRYAVRRVKS